MAPRSVLRWLLYGALLLVAMLALLLLTTLPSCPPTQQTGTAVHDARCDR